MSVVAVWGTLLACSLSVRAAEYHVRPDGDDAAAGTPNAPWRTLQKAARTARAGDTVIVHAGTYAGPLAPQGNGTKKAPIVFTKAAGQGKVVIKKPGAAEDSEPEGAVIHVRSEGGSWTRFVGFMLDGQAPWPSL